MSTDYLATAPAQRFLGDRAFIGLIAFLSAFVPLSTDLYLPALPTMAENLNAPASLVNLTLVAFFVCYGIGTLLWGPLSDKHGRKPILLVGLSLYVVASVGCALSPGIYWLIGFRALQAIGGGGATSVATAVVKDVYSGRRREAVLAVVQSMVMIAPIVAPFPGALLLQVTSWRGVFWTLAGVGLVAALGGLLYSETIPHRQDGTVLQSLGRLGHVLRNPGFSLLLVLFSLLGVATLAYVASSSYIFQEGFGVSELTYSVYFASNAVFAVLGPLLYVWLSGRLPRVTIITWSLGVFVLAGALICLVGGHAPWLFTLSVIPGTVASGMVRPPGANMMLEQQKEDTGSAASLMSCFGILAGSLGMLLISHDWANRVLALGVLYVTSGLTCAALWAYAKRAPFVRHPEAGAAKTAVEES